MKGKRLLGVQLLPAPKHSIYAYEKEGMVFMHSLSGFMIESYESQGDTFYRTMYVDESGIVSDADAEDNCWIVSDPGEQVPLVRLRGFIQSLTDNDARYLRLRQFEQLGGVILPAPNDCITLRVERGMGGFCVVCEDDYWTIGEQRQIIDMSADRMVDMASDIALDGVGLSPGLLRDMVRAFEDILGIPRIFVHFVQGGDVPDKVIEDLQRMVNGASHE